MIKQLKIPIPIHSVILFVNKKGAIIPIYLDTITEMDKTSVTYKDENEKMEVMEYTDFMIIPNARDKELTAWLMVTMNLYMELNTDLQ